MKIIEVNNLYTAFGENVVHNDISFSVNEGEIFGILGGSGSGKSVLVKQIVMLNQIQRGNIKIFATFGFFCRYYRSFWRNGDSIF